MRRSFLAVFFFAAAACIEVPNSIRAQFAGPGPVDRSNYRPGNHGSAPPVEEPSPVAQAAQAAQAATFEAKADGAGADAADGGEQASFSAEFTVDGGGP